MAIELKAFHKAKQLADSGNYSEAFPVFEALRTTGMQLDDLSNRVESYYGICLAMARKQTREGLTICKKAAEAEMFSSDVFLNLGKMYLAKNAKGKAYNALVKGLALNEGDILIERELSRIGKRRPPLVGFLDRDNFLNRILGRIRHFLKN